MINRYTIDYPHTPYAYPNAIQIDWRDLHGLADNVNKFDGTTGTLEVTSQLIISPLGKIEKSMYSSALDTIFSSSPLSASAIFSKAIFTH